MKMYRIVFFVFCSLIYSTSGSVAYAVDDVLERSYLLPGDKSSCGIQCLYFLSKYHGLEANLDQLVKNTVQNNREVSMLELTKQAEKLGFICHGYKEENIEKISKLPAIVHLKRGHYQLLLSVEGNIARIVDVPMKLKDISLEQFYEEWSGYFLTCELSKARKLLKPSKKGDLIYIESPDWNFGSRVSGEICKNTFKIVNASNKPVNIKSTKSSCGCIIAKSLAKAIQPNSVSEVAVKLRTKGKYGPQRGYILVTTDSSEYGHLEMTYKGNLFKLDGGLLAVPKLLFWGDVVKGNVEKRRVDVSKLGGGLIKYVNAECDIPSIKVLPLQKKESLENHGFDVILDSNSIPLGKFSGSVKLFTDHEFPIEISVPVEGNVVSEIRAFPSSVFAQVKEKQKISKSVQLENLLGKPLQINEIKTIPSSLPLKFSIKKESYSKCRIDIDIKRINKKIEQGELKVKIEGFDSEITIPVTIF